MPINVENMTSDVTVLDGDLPLSEAQLEKLVRLVIKRLKEQEVEGKYVREATMLRRQAAPSTPISE